MQTTTYNILILGHLESDGARWVLESYQAFGTLAVIEKCAARNAEHRNGVYGIYLNDVAQTEVRKNY